MTREEAKKLISDTGKDINIATSELCNNLAMEFDNIVDKIYNDFESRTCENCVNADRDNDCSLGISEQDGTRLGKDFGCNKWEKK